MFTGLVQEVGTVVTTQATPHGRTLEIAASFCGSLEDGESVAVNGVCLTVTHYTERTFAVYASEETLAKSGIGRLVPRSPVNLERALTLGSRLGGHIVQGHVDGTVTLLRREQRGPGEVFVFSGEPALLRYLVPKGSICLDGVSLTVNGLSETTFDIYAIPHTLGNTTLPQRRPGDLLNVEVDVLGKYLERFVQAALNGGPRPGLAELLRESGIGSGDSH